MGRGALIVLLCAPSLVFAALPIAVAPVLAGLASELAQVAVSIIVFYVSVKAWRFTRDALGMK